MNSSDILAKLMAKENIQVTRANVKTASFDVKLRVLTLPVWRETKPEVEDMMIGHEVGHALFTDIETLDTFIQSDSFSSLLKDYVNVIEDARIEKKIKTEYPGLRKPFNIGYKDLFDRGFFGFRFVNLIDRINIYTKVGMQSNVSFTQEELVLVREVDTCQSLEDVIALAKRVLEYSVENQKSSQKSSSSYDDSCGDDFGDEEYETETQSHQGDRGAIQGSCNNGDNGDDCDNGDDIESDEERALSPITQKVFDKSICSLNETNTVATYQPKLHCNYDDVIIGFKQVIRKFKENKFISKFIDGSEFQREKDGYKKFKQESKKIVSYLLKEFEMKKSADRYSRSTVSKSGELSASKLYAYKLSDDIFKRLTVIPDSKNHGMVFLLDWSGSMVNVIDDTIKQLINLVMFCRAANIPHRVYAFTIDIPKQILHTQPEKPCFASDRLSLIEFFSEKMTTSEFNTVSLVLLSKLYHRVEGFSLSSTPLNHSLLFLYEHLQKIQNEFNVDKNALVILTDGASAELSTTDGGRLWCRDTTSIIHDPATRKEYLFNYYHSQTTTLLTMLKNRYDIPVIGYYVVSSKIKDIKAFLRGIDYDGEHSSVLKSELMHKGFSQLPLVGYDNFYVLPGDSLCTDTDELVIDSKMTAKQLSNKFNKHMKSFTTSRVLLSRFVSNIA